MIRLLIWFLFLSLAYWALRLVWRVITGAPSRPGQTKQRRKSQPPAHEMIQDPNCGAYVLPSAAIHLRHAGRDLYFCSPRCQQQFLSSRTETSS